MFDRIRKTYSQNQTRTRPPRKAAAIATMQLVYAIFFLSVLGASALRNCDTYCKDKGKCFTEMTTKNIKCDSNAQQRKECDGHNPFGGKKDILSAEIKKECCQITCYSLFTANKNLTCPVGHSAPTKEQRRHVHNPDKKPEDLQRECCTKTRVSCYTLLKDNKFTCPATHLKPSQHYLNNDIHEDMTKKTKEQVHAYFNSTCCREQSKCFQKLKSKKLDCDGFGTMPGMQDKTRDAGLTSKADTDDSTLQKQCCSPNCFSLMTEKKLTCKDHKILRESSDGHMPHDKSDESLQKECCRQNCYSKMKAGNLTCAKGSQMKDKTDMHDPRDATGDSLKGQCCRQVSCWGNNNYCYAAMSEKGIWGSCPENTMAPTSPCDGHWPFGHDHRQSDEDRMKIIKAKSAEEIKKGCCRQACYGTMKSKGLKCPTGYKGRGESDGHNPFGSDDWTKKKDNEITSQCCRKINKCYTKLRENNLDCKGYGRMIDEFSDWNADVDTSKLKTDEEIQAGCCQKTCSLVMTKKKLECDNSEELRCESHHRPHGWKSFEQPEADLKYACCQVESGPARKSFPGCKALLKCSGDDCDSKCPGDERIRDGSHDDPFRGSRDFTKMKEADLQKHCCRPSCYDQVNRRKLTCPVGTKMGFSKYDSHNPFGWNTDMRAQSDTAILDKCCKPLNKCYVKLTAMNLNCNGVGKFPGDTDQTNYDFDPAKLTNADDVKGKCCQMNCFYTMKKKSLKCKAGSPRGMHDGHNPFGSDGFATQTDDKILEQCCSENCFSYFKANSLTCASGEARDEDDFHHVDFKSLKKPEDAKGECCRQDCGAALKSKGMSCGEGQMERDRTETSKRWNEYDEKRMKGECCEKLSTECADALGKAKKRAKWVDKRPKTAAALVAYLNKWGDKIIRAKTTGMMMQVLMCKKENKNFKNAEECSKANKGCCFVCDKIDCNSDVPSVSTCANNEPSAFMKKFERTSCSTSGRIQFNPKTDCGVCPSPRDLFEQFDEGKISTSTFYEQRSGLGSTKAGFYGGTNMHNVGSEVRIDDKVCPEPAAGLLITPHNSGTFALTGQKGSVFAILGVVNEKSTDPAKGVKLGGAADYLVIGGKNEGNVDFATTGKVSVVGVDNKGEVSASAAENILVGNTVNSGKVILGGKTGAIVNVDNKAGAEVSVSGKGGTWKLDDVSNAKGGKVILDSDNIEIDGAGTRNDGTVEFKRGKIVAKVKANTGTITIADGVTGTLLLCKNDGTITNNGQVKVTTNADDAFCSRTVTQPTKEAVTMHPELFFCRESAKYLKTVFIKAKGDEKETLCGEAISQIKEFWPAMRRDVDNADIKLFFKTCCAPDAVPPKGKVFKRVTKIVKRKIVRAKTTVGIDFTNDENKDKKVKFERVYIKRAKAKSGTFSYTSKNIVSSRRRLQKDFSASEGSAVSVVLEYDDDTAAEAGQAAVAAKDFASGLKEDLKKEGVETTVTETSATIETLEETEVEEILVESTETTLVLSMGMSMFSNPMIAFASTLVALGALF